MKAISGWAMKHINVELNTENGIAECKKRIYHNDNFWIFVYGK